MNYNINSTKSQNICRFGTAKRQNETPKTVYVGSILSNKIAQIRRVGVTHAVRVHKQGFVYEL